MVIGRPLVVRFDRQVDYADGESESVLLAAEEIRLLMAPCEELAPPSLDELFSASHAVTAAAAAEGAPSAFEARATAVQQSVAAGMPAALARQEAAAATAATASAATDTSTAAMASTAVDSPPAVSAEATSASAAAGAPASAALPREAAATASAICSPGQAKGPKSGKSGGSKGGGRRSSGAVAAAKPDEDAFLPGEVVWVGVKGWCHWPALVMTKLHLDDLKVPGALSDFSFEQPGRSVNKFSSLQNWTRYWTPSITATACTIKQLTTKMLKNCLPMCVYGSLTTPFSR